MDSIKKLVNKKSFMTGVILILLVLILWIYFMVRPNDEKEVKIQNVELEELQIFFDKEILSGIEDLSIEKGSDVDLGALVDFDGTIIKNVETDDSQIDYDTKGNYEAVYTITFDGDSLRRFLDENEAEVSFDTEGTEVIVRVVSDITITDETEKENEEVSSNSETGSNPSSENNTSASDPTGTNENTNKSPNKDTGTSHQHQWQPHYAERWVSNIVTVVDVPEQKVSGARFYVKDAQGNLVAQGPTYWFENGFTLDDLKEIIKNGIKNADDEGLYEGVYYGNYQNVTKTIPAVTHEEDQGYYEKYIDYYFCSCGATKGAE
ncbi:hypothetical protein [uncultured Traorella sp.]|uniref:hypothetical protein n=1 Tax=uncultured Traorella sp. TaxID=1929048 RepID=UPI0025EDEC97|nr:hypothetical protein [uncultured Traorella sp.]